MTPFRSQTVCHIDHFEAAYVPARTPFDRRVAACRLALAITWFVTSCILVSTAFLLAESLPRYKDTHVYTDIQTSLSFLNAIFAVEFVARLATCPDYRAYVRDVNNWIDMLALVPFYIDAVRFNPHHMYAV